MKFLSLFLAVATSASAIGLKFQWVDNTADETGFAIERATGNVTTGFVEIARVAKNVVFYDDASLPVNTVFSYRVRAILPVAIAPSGFTAYGPIVSGSTFPVSINNPPSNTSLIQINTTSTTTTTTTVTTPAPP